jgi:predicted nucleotidyltransferase
MKWPQHREFDLKDRTILLGYVGSVAHGTSIFPKEGGIDDKDVMGVCVPPKDFYLGIKNFEQFSGYVDEYDITIYEARKFIKLLLKNNPNVLSLLWLSPNHYIFKSEAGELLINNRDIFTSKSAYTCFCGYAYGQLKRMTHYKFEGYMGAKRKELVDKFGYDTKNAAHLVRILRMGIEFLTTGELHVQRHDAAQLIDIKSGMYGLDVVQKMAEELFKHAEEAYYRSTLPAKPDYDRANKLLVEIVESRL